MVSQETWTYINYALVAAISLLFIRRFFSASSDDGEMTTISEPLIYTKYTLQTLAKYDGVKDPRVLLAVKGKVFDVTPGKGFYGPGGPYANFAGHDASRGLAKNSFDDEMITPIKEPIDTLSDLTDEELRALDEWSDHFAGKYTEVGELVSQGKED